MTGMAVAGANLTLAWLVMWHVRPTSSISIPSPALPTGDGMFDASGFIAASMVSYQHVVNIVGATFAFALLGIGFSLFVIGIENTFNLKAEGTGLGKLTMASVSPGIACILAASTLIGITLLRHPTFRSEGNQNNGEGHRILDVTPGKRDEPMPPPSPSRKPDLNPG